MWHNPQETTDLVKLIEEILNGKLNYFCGERCRDKKAIFIWQSHTMTYSQT